MSLPGKILVCLSILLLSYSIAMASHIPNSKVFNTDTEPPVITSPAISSELPCGDVIDSLQAWYMNYGHAEATDNNQGVSFIANPSLAETIDIFENSSDTLCGNTQEVFVTFKAIDSCGNVSLDSSVALFATIDTLNPVLLTIPTNVEISCDEMTEDSLVNWINNYGGATVTDNCADSVNWTSFLWSDVNGNNGFGFFDEGPYIPIDRSTCDWSVNVSFLVVDLCGNLTATTGTFSVIDTIGPQFDFLPMDTSALCNSIPDTATVNAYDACDGDLMVSFTESTTQSSDSLLCGYHNYDIIRTWEAMDACGHTISHTQTISLFDTIVPGFQAPMDVTLDCIFLDSLNIAGQPTNFIDNCSVVLTAYADSAPSSSCEYDIERTWVVSDVCGNSSTFVQNIHVESNLPPTFIQEAEDVAVTCDSLFNINFAFAEWVNSAGGAEAAIGCGQINSFAAVPGSYDISDPSTYPGTPVGSFDAQECPSQNQPFIRSETVDFVIHDECGNANVTTATFGLIDTIAPIIPVCPSNYMIDNDPGQCGALVNILPPDAMDNCGQTESPYIENQEQQIVSQTPGDNQVIVDSLLFQFGPINLNNTQANGGVSLVIDLSNLDSDDPTEFFIIKAEDGTIIDSTEITALQCDDQIIEINTLTVAQINDWASDGFIDIWLIPNDPGIGGVFAINDVCGGSFANVSLSFDIDLNNAIQYSMRINQGLLFNVGDPMPVDTLLDVGVNEIEHIFTDCSGNQTSCFQNVTIVDVESPIVTCPNDILRVLPQDSCTVPIPLSNEFAFDDNCFGSNYYEQVIPELQEDSYISFSTSPVTNTFVADNQIVSFTGVSPILYGTKEPLLNILLSGDTDQGGEYFNILGEDGSFLGRTIIGTDCGFTTNTIIALDIPTYNLWAVDGQLDITLVSNIDVSVDGGGINPCGPLMNDMDSLSTVQVRLRYGDGIPQYYTTGATVTDTMDYPLSGAEPIINFNVGLTQVYYIFSDQPGNQTTCSYDVVVRDEQNPEVACNDLVVFIHPSGLQDYVIEASEIENSSNDNCAIDSFSIVPNNFTCADVGQTVVVDYFVFDKAGNSSSCQSEVKIESTVLTPSFSSGICEGDTLKLFANVPDAGVANAYTFSWTGPQGFTSNVEDPIIINPDPSYSGTYTLVVEGFNGCISEGIVEVTIEQLVTPMIELSSSSICTGDEILLNATPFTGDVNYLWYEGVFPSGILLASTVGPSVVLSPTIGDHFYYVIVESPNCTTNPSSAEMLMVLDPPVATVTEPFITICEGDDLALATDDFNANYSYSWTGPDNFTSNGQFADVIENVGLENQGLYNLVITLGSCVSDTATASVVIFSKPELPIISGNSIYCQGNTVLLSVNNVPNADLYTWYQDGVIFNTTVSNNLIIPNADTNLSGDWTVVIDMGICSSDASSPLTVSVEEQIVIGASNNGPLCEGDMVQLNATFIPNTSYSWEAPDGTVYNVQNPLVPAQEGDWTLTIMTNSGCESTTSTNVEINSAPTITALSNNSTMCMDGATSVEFFPSVIPAGNYTYEWSGPNGFMSDSDQPSIENVTSDQNGMYTLIVYNQNCPSEPLTTEINVTDIPVQPEIEGDNMICEGDSLTLTGSIYQSPNVLYKWETPLGQLQFLGPEITFSESANQSNAGFYILTAELDGCPSMPSDTFFVQVLERPTPPQITGLNIVCEGDNIELFVNGVIGANYEWEYNNSIISNSEDLLVENVNELNAGDYRVRAIIGDCISDWSESFFVDIVDRPITPEISSDDTGICFGENVDFEICISDGTFEAIADYDIYINGIIWNTTNSQCFNVNGLNDLIQTGNNVVSVVATVGSCSSLSSEALNLEASIPPNIEADLLEDVISQCVEDDIILSAMDGPPDVTVSWSSNNSDIDFTDPNGQETGVFGLSEGAYEVYLSYSFGACSSYSIDTAQIILEDVPDAINDSLFVNYNGIGAVNLVNNDIISSDYELVLIDQPAWGSAEIVGNIIEYQSDPRFSGEVVVSYSVCSMACPDVCDVAQVIITIGSANDCFAPTIITPNADGINDSFVIPCLSSGLYPQNEVKIFNQWGDEVFGENGYENDWEGTYNGSDLPVGTYYYIIRFDSDSEPINGFLILER